MRVLVVCAFCKRRAWAEEGRLPERWEAGPRCRQCVVIGRILTEGKEKEAA